MYYQRNESVRTLKDCHFGTINLDKYKKFMSKKTSMAKLKEIHFLRQDVFKDISEITFNRKFFKFFSNYSLKKNDVIFEKNDPTDEILFIRNGEIELSLKISLNEMKKMISKLILLTNNFPPLDCQSN